MMAVKPRKSLRAMTVVLLVGLLLWGQQGTAAGAEGGGSPPSRAPAPSAAEAMLVGTWLGAFQPQPGAPLQRFLTTRRADGTYTLVARMYEEGKPPSELVNSGLWGVSNGLYFTVTTEIDGVRTDSRNPVMINAYLVGELQPDAFGYQHVLSGYRFQVTRVAPDTRLP